MINKYLEMFLTVLVFCSGIKSYSQTIIKEGVDFTSRRLSFLEQKQDRALEAYAKACFLLSDQNYDFDLVTGYLCQALTEYPKNIQLLSSLATECKNHKDAHFYFSKINSILSDCCDPDELLGNSSMIGAEILDCSGLSISILVQKLEKENWSSQTLIQYLLKILTVNLIQKEDIDSSEKIFKKLVTNNELLNTPKTQLLFLNFLNIYFQSSATEETSDMKTLQENLFHQVWNFRKKYINDMCFSTMLAVLAEAKDWEKIDAFLTIPEVEQKFHDREIWFEFRFLAFLALKKTEEANVLLTQLVDSKYISDKEWLMSLANDCINLRQFEFAIKIYKRLLDSNPTSISLRMQIASLFLYLEDPLSGIEILMPIQLLPFKGYILLSDLWQKSNNLQNAYICQLHAERVAMQNRQFDLLNSSFYHYLGLTALRLGKKKEGLDNLWKAYRMDSKDVGICNSLGYTLLDYDTQLSKAEELIMYAYTHDSENLAVIDSAAMLYLKQKKSAKALHLMIKVLKEMPIAQQLDPEILDHAYQILKANGFLQLAEFYKNRNKE